MDPPKIGLKGRDEHFMIKNGKVIINWTNPFNYLQLSCFFKNFFNTGKFE